jgi:hypothetical protein
MSEIQYRNVDTLSKFKSELKKIDETENHSVPKHFFCGPRKLNIILTQLRYSASFLNFDLSKIIRGIFINYIIKKLKFPSLPSRR